MPKAAFTATFATLLAAVLLFAVGGVAEARLATNQQERAVAKLVRNHPKQGRPRLVHDSYLHLVARAKALDMAKRDYFGHVDPDGIGANHRLKMTGYGLPDYYAQQRDVTNIEALAAGDRHTPKVAFAAWMNSPDHRVHVLATDPFFADQTRFGVGYAKSVRSKYTHYYVFVSAPPSTAKLRPLTKKKVNLFLRKTPRQIERLRGKKG